MTEHFDEFGAVTTLAFVGCIDCSTERGIAWACCQGLRCATCHDRHRTALDTSRGGKDA